MLVSERVRIFIPSQISKGSFEKKKKKTRKTGQMYWNHEEFLHVGNAAFIPNIGFLKQGAPSLNQQDSVKYLFRVV